VRKRDAARALRRAQDTLHHAEVVYLTAHGWMARPTRAGYWYHEDHHDNGDVWVAQCRAVQLQQQKAMR
jgi:hypothetical protein